MKNPLFRITLALGLCDLGSLALLMMLPVLWLFAPVVVSIGTLRITLAWHVWWYALPAALLATRWLVCRRAIACGVRCQALWERVWFRKVVFSLISTFLVFDVCEVVLVKIGFEVQLPEIVIEGKNAQGKIHIAEVESDPYLLWRFAPGSVFSGRKINRMGFREREVEPVKVPGQMRVLCLGDSVTAQGRPGYAELLHRRLSAHPPTSNRWEAFNMGVFGYSAAQGLRLFEMTKDQVRPDIVTLYFGWNDHWLNNRTDYQLMALKMRPFAGHLVDALRSKRFFQLLVWATDRDGHIRPQAAEGAPSFFHSVNRSKHELWDASVLRVPPQEYRSLLIKLVCEIRAVHAIPVLITAPRRHLNENIVLHNYAHSQAEGERLHDEYLDITRTAAHDTQAELLDLAKLFADHDCDAFFRPDGIHFDYCEREETMTADPPTQPGLERIAEELEKKVDESRVRRRGRKRCLVSTRNDTGR